jgi:hypothetical protein
MNELIDGQLKRNLKPIYFTNYQINEQCILIIYSHCTLIVLMQNPIMTRLFWVCELHCTLAKCCLLLCICFVVCYECVWPSGRDGLVF